MISTYFAFAVAITLLIASPGPVVALVMADARHTWPVWTILGGALSAQLLLATALLTIYLALDINPLILDWGRLVGGLYLAWLGLTTLRSSAAQAGAGEHKQSRYFWRTLQVGLSNPKDILFFLAFLPGFVLPAKPFAEQALALTLIWAAIDVSILLLYSLLSRQILLNRTGQRFLQHAPGVFLLGLGLLSFALGLRDLLG